MSDQLSMFPLMTCESSRNAISSAEFSAGLSPSGSQVGQIVNRRGPDHAHVSRFRALDREKDMPTNDTCGPLFTASSPSAVLQSFLENRLHQRMGVNGSPLYALTWKSVDMPSGPPICALRASARRISVNGSILERSGWPTPDASAWNLLDTKWEKRRKKCAERHGNNGFGLTIGMAAQLAGWPTSRQAGGEKNVRTAEGPMQEITRKGAPQDLAQAAAIVGWPTPRSVHSGHTTGNPDRMFNHKSRLEDAVFLAGWPTPTSKEAAGGEYKDPEKALARVLGPHSNDLRDFAKIAGPARLTASGEMLTGSSAGMESGGQLNPRFSGYLQGYQMEWCQAALNAALHIRLQKEKLKRDRRGLKGMETQSSRKLQLNSSLQQDFEENNNA